MGQLLFSYRQIKFVKNSLRYAILIFTLSFLLPLVASAQTEVINITVDGKTAQRDGNEFSVLSTCKQHQAIIDVTADPHATVIINGVAQNPAIVNLPAYGNNIISIIITAQNSKQRRYTLTLNKPVPFDQIVITRWNHTITVINNPANNGGYTFTSYKWFRNGLQIGTEQSWSVANSYAWLNPADIYYVEMTANGVTGIIRSCEGTVSLK